MERVAVQSSNLEAVGYDPAEKTLEVVFRPNRMRIKAVWRYSPVPQETYESMLREGSSPGTILNGIKTLPQINAYKVGEEPEEAVA